MTATSLSVRTVLCAGTLSLSSLGPVQACLWDSDTIRDETQKGTEIFDLVVGQIAHHGDVYYRHRVATLTAAGKRDKASRNDLAVALVRLKRYDEARAMLEDILAKNPNDYSTLSNLGVLAKKAGDYTTGAKYIEAALKIKPAGHMGLGDWYLKMLQWRKTQAANNNKMPDKNFLGEPYEELKMHHLLGSQQIKLDRLVKLQLLVSNDQTFSDGFLVLGDALLKKGLLHLAYLSYVRASELGHPNKTALHNRTKLLTSQWKQAGAPTTTIATARGYFQASSKWLSKFQAQEAALVNKKKILPSFKQTRLALEASGVRKVSPSEKSSSKTPRTRKR